MIEFWLKEPKLKIKPRAESLFLIPQKKNQLKALLLQLEMVAEILTANLLLLM
jgi:hypothetical protein